MSVSQAMRVGASVSGKRNFEIDDIRIGKMMEEFGFNPQSSTATARALILNLVRSAYGPDAAREFMRQMNLEKNRNVESTDVIAEFEKSLVKVNTPAEIPGVGTHETQLSLFGADFDEPAGKRRA